MNKTIINLLLGTTLCLFGWGNSASAQNTASEVLNSLTFEAPKVLYHVKGNTANVRTQPSTKAAKALRVFLAAAFSSLILPKDEI